MNWVITIGMAEPGGGVKREISLESLQQGSIPQATACQKTRPHKQARLHLGDAGSIRPLQSMEKSLSKELVSEGWGPLSYRATRELSSPPPFCVVDPYLTVSKCQPLVKIPVHRFLAIKLFSLNLHVWTSLSYLTQYSFYSDITNDPSIVSDPESIYLLFPWASFQFRSKPGLRV